MQYASVEEKYAIYMYYLQSSKHEALPLSRSAILMKELGKHFKIYNIENSLLMPSSLFFFFFPTQCEIFLLTQR